jgi:hypothetical protein
MIFSQSPERRRMIRRISPKLALYAGEIVQAVLDNPSIQEKVIAKSEEEGTGHATFFDLNRNIIAFAAHARGGQLMRLSGMQIPIMGTYCSPMKHRGPRLASLIINQQGRSAGLEQLPSQLEIQEHNTSISIYEAWADIGFPGTISSTYSLDPAKVRKETKISGLSPDQNTDSFPYFSTRQSTSMAGIRPSSSVVIESPLLESDLDRIHFVLSSMANTVEHAGIPVQRSPETIRHFG